MTIDEAILFCDWKSKNIKLKTEPDTFVQIATWLRELKELRGMVKCDAFSDGYDMGIDVAVEWVTKHFVLDCFDCPTETCFYSRGTECRAELIRKIKEKKND